MDTSGNETKTMNPTHELVMIFNSKWELTLKSETGEGPWGPQLCQLE